MSTLVAKIRVSVYMLPIFGAVLAFCPHANANSASQGESKQLLCYVSILPQKYFVERIAGEFVEVQVMVGPGQSPATYEPTGKQLARLSGADLYFSIGVAFEKSLVPRIEGSFDKVEIVDISRGIERRRIEGHSHPNGEGDAANGQDEIHVFDDPHIWLAPRLAIRISENILQALCKRDPDHKKVYTQNYDALIIDILDADRRVSAILSIHSGQEVFVFHPAYGYFTDAYGLVQVPIEVDGGPPGPKHLAEIIEHAEAESVTTIFVQPQFSLSPAQKIANTIGAKIVILDPLAEDFTNNLVVMAERIAAALTTNTASE